MSISKIDRVVLNPSLKTELDNKATKTELNDAKTDLINQINAVVTSLDYKEAVNTFTDLATTYPIPQEGWTVAVKDSNITYKYCDGVWVDIGVASTPLATSTNDGLFSRQDKTKLDTIEQGAEANPTANEILQALKTVDGAGSGLDSDTLNGKYDIDFATATHIHDGRYFTESETTTLLNGKANTNHIHNSYTHIQITATTTWNIVHNLGKSPSVTVVDSAGSVVVGDIAYVSINEITVSFSAAFSGLAYLN